MGGKKPSVPSSKRWLVSVGVLGVMFTAGLAGCARAAAPADTATEAVLNAIEGARQDTLVSDGQLAVLEAAAAEVRDVTEEEYTQAYRLSVECLHYAGFTDVTVSTFHDNGSVSYEMTVSDAGQGRDALFSAMDSCERQHSAYIEWAFLTRTEAREWIEAQIEAFMPALLQCLRDRGVDLPSDSTYEDVALADLGANEAEGVEEGCIQSTGLNDVIAPPPEEGENW